MPTAILKAHYDGEHIVLDEPFELPANAPLMVTVIAPDADAERSGGKTYEHAPLEVVNTTSNSLHLNQSVPIFYDPVDPIAFMAGGNTPIPVGSSAFCRLVGCRLFRDPRSTLPLGSSGRTAAKMRLRLNFRVQYWKFRVHFFP